MYINPGMIEYEVFSSDKSLEVMVSFQDAEIDWEIANKKILDATKKVIDVAKGKSNKG